jgi:hypothetical protein
MKWMGASRVLRAAPAFPRPDMVSRRWAYGAGSLRVRKRPYGTGRYGGNALASAGENSSSSQRAEEKRDGRAELIRSVVDCLHRCSSSYSLLSLLSPLPNN